MRGQLVGKALALSCAQKSSGSKKKNHQLLKAPADALMGTSDQKDKKDKKKRKKRKRTLENGEFLETVLEAPIKKNRTGRTSRLTSRASSGDLGCQNCDIFSPARKSALRPKPTREMYNLGCLDLLGSGDMGDALAARFIALHQKVS